MANCKLLFNTIQAIDNINLAHTSTHTMINKLNKQILLGKSLVKDSSKILNYKISFKCKLCLDRKILSLKVHIDKVNKKAVSIKTSSLPTS